MTIQQPSHVVGWRREGATLHLNVECPFCSTVNSISVDVEQFDRWLIDTPIQNAFPELSDDDRELIKSGICCWDTALPSDDESENIDMAELFGEDK